MVRTAGLAPPLLAAPLTTPLLLLLLNILLTVLFAVLPAAVFLLAALLQELCADPANEVLIFSGSEMAKLEETFGELPVWLAAENGVYVRPPIGSDLPQVCMHAYDSWLGGLRLCCWR